MKGWLTKSEEASLADIGNYPGSRKLFDYIQNGIIILDKPSGPTSHQVDAWIKEIFNNINIGVLNNSKMDATINNITSPTNNKMAGKIQKPILINKCSHGGTLDPRVSGVLVIALENATKLMPILLKCKKEYVALVYLHKEVPQEKIRRVCKEFIGKIKQLPPKKSAVAKRVRERSIYSLKILEISERYILMRVGCEAGTYIRRLADDIGKRLKTGAHLQELRRVSSGSFTEDQCVTMQDLIDAIAFYTDNIGAGSSSPRINPEQKLREIIHPLEIVANGMKNIVVKDSAILNIVKGAPVYSSGLVRVQKDIKPGDVVGIFSLKGEMIGFGNALMNSKEMLRGKKKVVKTDRILVKI